MTDAATADQAPSRLPSSPLAIPAYRRFWLARFANSFATSAMVVVIGWQTYDVARGAYHMSRDHAAFQLGVLGLVQFVPLMLLTPVAGWAADRFDRRFVGAMSSFIDMLVGVALLLATLSHALNLPLLFMLASLHGVARVFSGPAIGAIAPNLVPPELLPRAMAINSLAWQSASILGPAAGGFLYAVGAAVPYAMGAVVLLCGGLALLTLPRMKRPELSRHLHPLRQMIEGLAYVRNERFLLGCITLDLFAVLLGGATALLPVYARDILHVGPVGLGWMRAAPAAGAAITGIALATRPIEREVGAKMLWAVAVFGAATLVFGVSRNLWLSLAMLALLGAADMISVFIRNTLVQLNTPDAMRGRVQSVSGLAISASNELGEMESGLLAAMLGATGAVVFGGIGAIVVTALWSVIFPELKRARSFAPQYRDQKEPAT